MAAVHECVLPAVVIVQLVALALNHVDFPPHALSVRALTRQFLYPALSTVESQQVLRCVPSSLDALVKAREAVMIMQSRMRKHKDRRQKNSNPKKKNLISWTGGIARRVPLAPFNEATTPLLFGRLLKRQNSVRQAAVDLTSLLLPLKTFLLREMYHYLTVTVSFRYRIIELLHERDNTKRLCPR
jgi:hypothetical protein